MGEESPCGVMLMVPLIIGFNCHPVTIARACKGEWQRQAALLLQVADPLETLKTQPARGNRYPESNKTVDDCGG